MTDLPIDRLSTPPGSVQMSTNEDIHPMSTNEDIHDLVDRKCTCGWEPALGTSIYRSFDKHLFEVRWSSTSSSSQTGSSLGDEPRG